jgi:putative membrane protein
MARRLFTAPPPRRMIVPIAAFSLMEGFLVAYPALDLPRTVLLAVAFAVPAYLAAGLTTVLAERLGGRMYLRRSALLAFVGLLAVGSCLLVGAVAASVASLATGAAVAFPMARIAALGYGIVFWARLVILASTSNSDYLRSLPAATLHPVLGLAALAAVAPLGPWDVALGTSVYAIFGMTAIAFAEIAKRPLLRSFGVDGLKLLRHTLDHYTELEDVGVSELEGFFHGISVPARVRIAGFAFRAASGLKALFLAPNVHPGPMGYVGGSDLPTKIASGLADVTQDVIVAHGPTTHDDNPATTAEVRKIPAAVREALRRVAFSEEAGRSVRVSAGKASMLAQTFGDAALLVASFAPNPTDDIDGATGHAALQEAKLVGASEAVLVDAHNCLVPGAGLTHFGSAESHEIREAAKAATRAALATPRSRPAVGYARRTGFATPEQGIGARGIEALVVDVGGQRTAYVLFDGNNMIPGLRDEIRSRIAGVVQESEILTTDNHSVNLTMDGFNAVGAVLDRAVILEQAEGAVRDAIARLEPVLAGVLVAEIPDFRIFGPQSASRLTTSINSTMAVLRPALYVTMAGALAASALVLAFL